MCVTLRIRGGLWSSELGALQGAPNEANGRLVEDRVGHPSVESFAKMFSPPEQAFVAPLAPWTPGGLICAREGRDVCLSFHLRYSAQAIFFI